MKLEKNKSGHVAKVMTGYVIYYPNKHSLITRYFLEKLFFPIFKKSHKYFIVSDKKTFPHLGLQQVSPTFDPQLLYKQNNYSYSPPPPNKTGLLIIFFILFLLIIFLFSQPDSSFTRPFTALPVESDYCIFYFFKKPLPIATLNYDLTLSSGQTLLAAELVFRQNLSQILTFHTPCSFTLQKVLLNHRDVTSAYILTSHDTLSLDSTKLILKNQTLTLIYNSLQRPSRLIFQLPLSQVLISHTLNLFYPPKDLITVNKNPEFAKPGLLRYNLPVSTVFMLNIKYDQTLP